MHIKTIVSAVALSAALGFSGMAYAQSTIGGQAVSEADMERVKVYCEDLQNQANQAEGATGAEDELTETDSNSGTDDTASATDDGDDDSATVGSIDMDAITVEACMEGGFLDAAAQ